MYQHFNFIIYNLVVLLAMSMGCVNVNKNTSLVVKIIWKCPKDGIKGILYKY